VRALGKIITLGLSPAWDITCRGEGLDWGLHKDIAEQIIQPAGKALNISRALAWMGQASIAAGLWGRDDYEQMLKAMRPLRGLVKIKMTTVIGRTRRNITVVDTANNREMHLRNRSELASTRALRTLKAELDGIVNKNSVCVFAGSMPGNKLLGEVLQLIKFCSDRGARVAVDSSGDVLKELVDSGGIWLIKPNIEELSGLVGEQIKDSSTSLTKAGRSLLGKVKVVLISRGKKGAIAVTRDSVWQGRCIGRKKVLSTVGCGDYLLAGFIKGLKDRCSMITALATAIKLATARAWGWTKGGQWQQVKRQIKVEVARLRI